MRMQALDSGPGLDVDLPSNLTILSLSIFVCHSWMTMVLASESCLEG